MEPNRAPIFLDTAYVNALVNTRDQWHDAAMQWERKLAVDKRRLITTEFVLVEIADGLAAVRFRMQAVQVVATLQASPLVEADGNGTRRLSERTLGCAVAKRFSGIAPSAAAQD